MDHRVHAGAIGQAGVDHRRRFVDAARDGITGKAVTPYLLGAILKKTGGRSLTANIALIKNNARLAAEIAVALAA